MSATISQELSNGTTTLHVTSPTTTTPFSLSVVGRQIDSFGRERGNSSGQFGQFRGDVYVNGRSMRQTLERELNIKCGMVIGDYSIRLGDIINIWFYSKRTTVNLVGINQEFGSFWLSQNYEHYYKEPAKRNQLTVPFLPMCVTISWLTTQGKPHWHLNTSIQTRRRATC